MESLPASEKRRHRSWLAPVWFVPILAAVVIGYVVHHEFSQEGPVIKIIFHQADGLEADKTDLRYRGVKMGEVSQLKLTKDMTAVIAEVRLEESASALARQGSKFWIVRPHVSAAGVKALGTLVTGPYIAVLPGGGTEQDTFDGLEKPPPVESGRRGLEILLLSPGRSFEAGAPILYHSLTVGAVADSTLTEDARSVCTRVIVEQPYNALVRANSRFWNAGGVKAHAGLFSGIQIGAESFTTLVEGGIEFATPDTPGAKAKEDETFTLAENAKDDWKKWRPAIPLPDQSPESAP